VTIGLCAPRAGKGRRRVPHPFQSQTAVSRCMGRSEGRGQLGDFRATPWGTGGSHLPFSVASIAIVLATSGHTRTGRRARPTRRPLLPSVKHSIFCAGSASPTPALMPPWAAGVAILSPSGVWARTPHRNSGGRDAAAIRGPRGGAGGVLRIDARGARSCPAQPRKGRGVPRPAAPTGSAGRAEADQRRGPGHPVRPPSSCPWSCRPLRPLSPPGNIPGSRTQGSGSRSDKSSAAKRSLEWPTQ
jgi:hypothetical protein